jgi:hypothetical protein
LNVKDSNLFYQDLSRYILIIETYFDEWIGTIWVAFQVSIFIIKFKIEIHMFYTGYAIMKDKSKIPHNTSACGKTNKELVFNQCCLNFPLINAIVTRRPRCATFYIEISYFVFITLSCQILFAMNKCIWYFGLVLHNSISCVKHMDFYFKFYDENWNLKCNPNCPYS